jgi:hypothetical protein
MYKKSGNPGAVFSRARRVSELQFFISKSQVGKKCECINKLSKHFRDAQLWMEAGRPDEFLHTKKIAQNEAKPVFLPE